VSDEYEVRVHDVVRGRLLVAAIEIVKPTNKIRPNPVACSLRSARRCYARACRSSIRSRRVTSTCIPSCWRARKNSLASDGSQEAHRRVAKAQERGAGREQVRATDGKSNGTKPTRQRAALSRELVVQE
jgi:hypothetical protein